MNLDSIQAELLRQISGIHEIPQGAYNIRVNGQAFARNSSEHIHIEPKTDGKSGIDIYVDAGTKNESVHIPVLLSQTGLKELVYNDFHIGAGADITIVAGCGIHNGGDDLSEHSGIHSFFVGKGAKVRYIEKHYGSGEGSGKRVMDPVTSALLDDDAYMEIETVQIRGVDSSNRTTNARLGNRAVLVIKEKMLTDGTQHAVTNFTVDLDGKDCGAHLISRSVAMGSSTQIFNSDMRGNNRCSGHSECDAIIMDGGKVSAVPMVSANHVDSSLIHEAAIGKIAGEQLIKLMTLGLTEKEAEEQIINGFLK